MLHFLSDVCIVHPNSSSLISSGCTTAFVCELPDGSFVFTANEGECIQMSGGCSALCPGESCASYRFGLGGACFVNAATESDCALYGKTHSADVTYSDGACVIVSATDSQTCSQVSFSSLFRSLFCFGILPSLTPSPVRVRIMGGVWRLLTE